MSAKTKTTISNFSIYTLSNIFLQGSLYLLLIFFARLLTQTEYGGFIFYITLLSIFSTIGQAGMRNVIIRDIKIFGKEPVDIISLLVLPKFLLSICAGFIGILYCFTFAKETNVFFIIIFFLNTIVYILIDHFESYFIAIEEINKNAITVIVYTFFLIALIFVFWKKITLNYAISIVFISSFIRLLMLSKFSKCKYICSYIFRDSTIKYFFKNSLPFYWQSFLTIIAFQLPIIFLKMNSDLIQIGYFGIANKTANAALLIINSLTTILIPPLSQIIKNQRNVYFFFIKNILLIGTLIFSLMSIFITLFGEYCIIIIFGDVYLESAKSLSMLTWYITLNYIFSMIGLCLILENMQNILAKLGTLYVSIFIIFSYIGSYYGAFSMSIAFLISAAINFIYHWLYFKKKLIDNIDNEAIVLIGILFIGTTLISFCNVYIKIMYFLSVLLLLVFFKYFDVKNKIIHILIILKSTK